MREPRRPPRRERRSPGGFRRLPLTALRRLHTASPAAAWYACEAIAQARKAGDPLPAWALEHVVRSACAVAELAQRPAQITPRRIAQTLGLTSGKRGRGGPVESLRADERDMAIALRVAELTAAGLPRCDSRDRTGALASVAVEFDVSVSTVRRACERFEPHP